MIRQFDVIPNPIRAGRADRPYFINLQHDYFDNNGRRVLAPLVIRSALKMHPRLNPMFVVRSQQLFFMPNDLFTLSVRNLPEPIANLEAERYRIIAARVFEA